MIVLNNSKDKICVVELTVGFETNIAKNCKRKAIRYKDLFSSLKQRFGNVKYLKGAVRRKIVYPNFDFI